MNANSENAPYASVNDFVLRIGEKQAIELTDREPPFLGEVNQSILKVALVDSSSQMDGYLAGRYQLPLAKVPANLVRICCDLARFRLCSMTNVTISDEVKARYEEAIGELKLLAKGTTSLGVEHLLEADDLGESVVMFSHGNSRVFSRDHKD